MTLFSAILIALFVVVNFMSLLWAVATAKGKADIVDAGWTVCVGFSALFFNYVGDGDPLRRLLCGGLCLVWSLRLTTYLVRTRVLAAEEDGRYKTLRASWGTKANARFFLFFILQGVLAVFLASTFMVSAYNTSPITNVAIGGALILFLAAFMGETIADNQLHHFRSEPQNKGRSCDVGLWRYSRHPNYFFEWLHWLAYIPLAWGSPWFLLSCISPAVLLYLIMQVTGIPPTEARAILSRGDDYKRYQARTSAFFPWPPKI